MSELQIDKSRRRIGRSELCSFPLAYGCWRFAGTDVKTAREKIEVALELGINLFDNADVYGCDGGGSFGDAETLFGQVLADAPGLRERMLIATKGGIVLGVPYDSSSKYLRSAVEASLRRLQTETIDLYQIHRPDFLGHPEEIAEILSALRAEGKIKEVGVSNYTPSQFRALQAHLSFPIASHQPEFSCWRHEPLKDGLLDQCLEYQVTPLVWSPLAGGLIAASYETAQETDSSGRLVHLLKCLDAIADRQEVSRTAVALAWLLVHPSGVIPIIGTQKVERMKESIAALGVKLSRIDWNNILVAAQGQPLP